MGYKNYEPSIVFKGNFNLITPQRILEMAGVSNRGVAAALIAKPELFQSLFKLLWEGKVLRLPKRKEIHLMLSEGRLAEACAILLDSSAFQRKAIWSLFWSLTKASISICDDAYSTMHEPELNGAFMQSITSSIDAFQLVEGFNAALVIGNHATLGNEARTGADFGLIVEIEHGSETRHLVTLLQAKRATSRHADVRRAAGESTQLDRLVSSGIGSYLFYHSHQDPVGLGPTVRDADAVRDNPAKVDVLSPADDFAVRLAVAADNLFTHKPAFPLPGMGAADGREDALRKLFNPRIAGIRVNDAVVARVGSEGMPVGSVHAFKEEWHALMAQHRHAVEQAQGIFGKSGEEHEPPIGLG